MKLLTTLVVVALGFVLVGCGKGNPIQLTDSMVDETGKVTTTAIGKTAESSIAKEQFLLNAYNVRTQVTGNAHANTGFKSKPVTVVETVFYPGMEKPLDVKRTVYEVSYTPAVKFDQPLPTEPSVHAVWKWLTSATQVVGDIFKGWFILEGTKSILDRSGTQYGTYAPINQSYNPSTAPPYFAPIQ